jgi:hypothetical protein
MIIEEKDLPNIQGLPAHLREFAKINPSLFDGSLRVGDVILVNWVNFPAEKARVFELDQDGLVSALDWLER